MDPLDALIIWGAAVVVFAALAGFVAALAVAGRRLRGGHW